MTTTDERRNRNSQRMPRLGPRLTVSRAAMVWERIWPDLWPIATILALFAGVAWLDILPSLPSWLHAVILLIAAFAVVRAVRLAYRGFVMPSRLDAQRRLERDSGLDHRPLQVMEDDLPSGSDNPDVQALWVAHRERMAARIRNLRVTAPHPGVASRDMRAVRFAALAFAVLGLVVAGGEADERMARAVSPQFAFLEGPPPPELEIWITPPAYTGLAPVFPLAIAEQAAAAQATDGAMAEGDEDEKPTPVVTIPVPDGSELTARLSGGDGLVELRYGDATTPFENVDGFNHKISLNMSRGGALAVAQDGKPLGEWKIEIVPDAPPTVSFVQPPNETDRAVLRVIYNAGDDYGLDTARAEIRRSYEQGKVTGKELMTLDLPLPGLNAKKVSEATYHDLTAHPWAGLPVVVQLAVTDGADQEAKSEPLTMTLPERAFSHPVARAIIQQRKRLTTEPEQRESIVQEIHSIAARPGAYAHDKTVFLSLVSARARLSHDRSNAAIRPVQDLLWDTALRVEDGRLSIAERDLRRAQEALMRALAENAPDEELERLMRELENALNRFMQEMAQEMRNNPNSERLQNVDPNTQMMEMTDLRRMLEQIRQMMRSGARDAAREMLAQLRNILENMRMGRMAQQQGQSPQSQALRELQQLIQRQNQLLNRTFRQSQGRPNRDGSRQGQMTQREIREALQRLREQMSRMGQQGQEGQRGQQGRQQGQQGQGQQGGPGQALGDAERFMGRSENALGRGSPGDAVGPQGQALDALQRAGRGMMQQMMQQFGQGQGLPNNARFNPLRQRRDPLGRYLPGDEGMDTRDVTIPEESDIQRVQRILEELRKRSGERDRPRLELDYIERLLRRF